MILLYSILALLLTTYLVISAVYFFCNMEKYPYYRKIYRDLPSMNFIKDDIHITSGDFIWYVCDNDFALNDDIMLFDRGDYRIFNLYEWYWLCKYRRYFQLLIKNQSNK